MTDKQQIDLLIQNGTVVTMDGDGRVIEAGAIAVKGMEIVALGTAKDLQALYQAKETIDASGQVVTPGLVNTHTHLAMTILRGIADDMVLEPWLQRIWQLEGQFATAQNCRLGTQLALVEMIKGGTTTATDMYWHFEETTATAVEMGFRLVNGPIFIDFVGPDGIDPADRERLALDYIAQYKDHPLAHLSILAHAIYTVPEQLLRLSGALAQEYGGLFITHASESKGELIASLERFGKTPIEYLDSLELLTPYTLLAHCVQLNDAEIALLAERKTKVAHCPESNLKLGNGVARVAEMLAAGVTVGLGTDGAATNNDLDMWGEMRTAALLQKGARLDPTTLPAPQAFHLATLGGAQALGLDHLIGSLEVGKRADIVLVDFDQIHLTPFFDTFSHLVYAVNRNDVSTVVINGQVVMRAREVLTVDEEKVLAEARAVKVKIVGG